MINSTNRVMFLIFKFVLFILIQFCKMQRSESEFEFSKNVKTSLFMKKALSNDSAFK